MVFIEKVHVFATRVKNYLISIIMHGLSKSKQILVVSVKLNVKKSAVKSL